MERLNLNKKKQLETFSFNPLLNHPEEGKWLLAVTGFEATSSVFNMTNESNSSSISTPGHWSSRGRAETFNRLQNLIKLRSRNDIDLHVKKIEKRGTKFKKKLFI